MASEFAVTYITQKLESLPLGDVYLPHFGKNDISRFLYLQPWRATASLPCRSFGGCSRSALCGLELGTKGKELEGKCEVNNGCIPKPNAFKVLPSILATKSAVDVQVPNCFSSSSCLAEHSFSADTEISKLTNCISVSTHTSGYKTDSVESRTRNSSNSRFSPIRPSVDTKVNTVPADGLSLHQLRTQHQSPVRISSPCADPLLFPASTCETPRKPRRVAPMPQPSDLSPVISRSAPTRSPNKRKRSSDSLSAELSPITKSCDLEVSEICRESKCHVPRTLSFDEEMLTNGRFHGFVMPDWGINSAASRSLKRLRQRPSANSDRIRSFSVIQPNSNPCRKIKVLEVKSVDCLEESLYPRPRTPSQDAFALMHRDLLFRPISLAGDASS